jgi:hypothetical protein
MTTVLTTEDGEIITCESIAGITGLSTLNDINVQTIYKERFDTDPTLSGWVLGTQWQWDSINHNMKPV